MGRSRRFGGCLASVLWCATAGAATLEVTVHDREGQPIPDIVITAAAATDRPRAQLPLGVMDQIDQQFVPDVLVVQVGTSVVFPNSDTVAHQVYSFSPPDSTQDGDGWLLAYLFDYDEHWRFALEALEIDTTLAPRAQLGLPTQATERTLQLQIVYSF